MLKGRKLKSKGVEVLGQTRLSSGVGLWHLSGMAKRKKNAAAVAQAAGFGGCALGWSRHW